MLLRYKQNKICEIPVVEVHQINLSKFLFAVGLTSGYIVCVFKMGTKHLKKLVLQEAGISPSLCPSRQNCLNMFMGYAPRYTSETNYSDSPITGVLSTWTITLNYPGTQVKLTVCYYTTKQLREKNPSLSMEYLELSKFELSETHLHLKFCGDTGPSAQS